MSIDSYVSNSGVIRTYAFLIPFHDFIKYTRAAKKLENTDSELSKIARDYARQRFGDDIFKIVSLPFLGPAAFLFDFLDRESIWEMEKYVKKHSDKSSRT